MNEFTNVEEIMGSLNHEAGNQDNDFFRRRVVELLENAINTLPGKYRVVFMLRDAEGLSSEETVDCLGISEEAVKAMLHRARSLLRKELESRTGVTLKDLYPFAGERCDRIVAEVMKRISSLLSNSSY